jgi:hypothetical protein
VLSAQSNEFALDAFDSWVKLGEGANSSKFG